MSPDTKGALPASEPEMMPRSVSADQRSRGSKFSRGVAARREILVIYAVALALVVADALLQPEILTFDQLNLQTATTLTLIVVAAGQTIVMLSGGIDLSVGGILTLSTCLAATKFESGGGMMLWIPLIILIGVGAGLLNGLIVAYRGLQPFVVTLATWSIWNGVALLVLPVEGGSIPISYLNFWSGTVGKIGVPVIMVFVLVLIWLWFRSSRWAARVVAVGSNTRSAYLSGIPVRGTLVMAYAISGGLAAIAGLVLVSQTASGSPLFGSDYVLDSVAAAVIGGVSFVGARGSFIGAIAGAFTLTLVGSVIFAIGLESYWQPLLTGLLLIAAVSVNAVLNRRLEEA